MVGTRTKTLALQRAYFNKGFNSNLEDIIRKSFARLPNAKDRVVPIDLITSNFFAGFEEASSEGVFVRVLEFEQGAIGVVNLDTSDQAAAVEEFLHPDKRDFLKEQVVCYIVKDHIVACNMRNKSGTFASHVLDLAAKADVLSTGVRIRIADVPDRTTLARIREVGVRELDFSITTFFEDSEINARSRVGSRVIQMIFGLPAGDRAIKHRANAQGRMTLKRGRFEKDEVNKDEWLTEIGQELTIAGSADNYKMVLEDGTKISNTALKKSKPVKIRRHANSFSFDHAKAELQQYYSDLRADGALGV